jgi:hypothetical protein
MHLLPLSLGRLAEHAARGGSPWFALHGVLLRVSDDNTFEVVATDSRMLTRVTGPCRATPAALPEIPDFDTAPDGQTTALIPADAWRRAFTWARRLTAKAPRDHPAARSVAVRIGGEQTTFGATDGDSGWSEAAQNVSGRYPAYEEMIPPAGTGRDRLRIDPRLLIEMLRTAAGFTTDERPMVEIETFGGTRPLVIRTGQPGGPQFVGILMPLIGDAAPTAPAADDANRVAALERAYVELLGEREALARRVAELEAALAAASRPEPP